MSTIQHAIVERAQAQPQAVALRQGEVSVTYGELVDRSAAVAAGLVRLGYGRDSVVGVRMARTPDLLITLLGVLRSGAAYLPLDPNDPASRARAALQDAGASLVVTSSPETEVAGEGIACVAFGDLAGGHGAELPDVAGHDLAYVIFTSGSTGRPKGVAVPHHCVVAMLAAMGAEAADSPVEVWLSVTSASFDVSVFEFFAPLARGSVIEIADISGPRLFSTALAVADHDITHMQATPTLLAALMLDAASARGLANLHHVTSGGEALTPELALELRTLLKGRLLNGYGPTEATVWATVERIEAPIGESIAIGRPLAGQAMYVLNDNATPVDHGAVGELFIGGSGVAWGYLGQPGLTAERFLPDPFIDHPGARMYRTGDLGRLVGDGRFDCLGRNDRQVKIKGHRIELDEVENALTGLDQVQAGAVILVGKGMDRRIVAVVVGPKETDTRAIRIALGSLLTAAAVPTEVRVVPTLPVTTSGKVDRRALGDQTAEFSDSAGEDTASREVVLNQRGQHSIWWVDRVLPPGWTTVGFVGDVTACSADVDRIWPDIRPIATR